MKLYVELLAALVATLLFSAHACAQSYSPLPLECFIQRISQPNYSAHITCSIAGSPGKMAVRFSDEFAGVGRLSERIHSIKAVDTQQGTLTLEIRGNGLYLININSAGSAMKCIWRGRSTHHSTRWFQALAQTQELL